MTSPDKNFPDDHLPDAETPQAQHLLVHLSQATGPVRTLLLHPAGGGLMPYLPLASHLSGRGPVSAIRASGLLPGESPQDSVTAMVEAYLPVVEELAPDLIVGWSMGGILAWELAGRIAARTGGPAPAVVAIDSRAEAFTLSEAGLAAEGRPLVEHLRETIPGPLGEQTLAPAEAHVRANAGHTLSARQAGEALLLVCGDENVEHRLGAWSQVSDHRLRVDRLPGEHFDVFTPEVLPTLIGHLDRFLDTVLDPARMAEAAPAGGGR